MVGRGYCCRVETADAVEHFRRAAKHRCKAFGEYAWPVLARVASQREMWAIATDFVSSSVVSVCVCLLGIPLIPVSCAKTDEPVDVLQEIMDFGFTLAPTGEHDEMIHVAAAMPAVATIIMFLYQTLSRVLERESPLTQQQ